jgi:hypothetical protein
LIETGQHSTLNHQASTAWLTIPPTLVAFRGSPKERRFTNRRQETRAIWKPPFLVKAHRLRHLFFAVNESTAVRIAPHRGRGVIARYREFLPVSDSTPIVSLGEGGTPLIFSPRLSAIVGRKCEVYLK